MIESDLGQTDRPELGKRRRQAGALAEAHDGEMRKPRTPLTPIHAEPFEPLPDPVGEKRRAPALVGEDEHADAPRLAVTGRREHGRLDRGARLTDGTEDALDVASRSAAEEGDRDVKVLGRDEANAGDGADLGLAPANEALDRIRRQRQTNEET
jgi:hypothetical protein